MIPDYSNIVQARFRKMVYEKLKTDYDDHYEFIDFSKVDKMIDSGASLKEILIRTRENIAVEILKIKKQEGPDAPPHPLHP